jgi:hypothetical protein
MNKINQNLSEIFDVEPLEVKPKESQMVEVVEASQNDDAEADFAFARKNVKDLIKQGSAAVGNILEVAKASEHPRAYEVAATMLKTMADMNKDLLDMQKKRQDLNPASKPEAQQINVDKDVFVGSTAELIKQIKANK